MYAPTLGVLKRDLLISSIYVLLLGLHFMFVITSGHDQLRSIWKRRLLFCVVYIYMPLVILFYISYRMQHELEVSTKQPIFVDSSISDTIRTCIVLGNHRAALKVKVEFKVRDHYLKFVTFWIDLGVAIKISYLFMLQRTYIGIIQSRYRRNDGIGSKFLPWQQLGIGMPWKSFQRRKGLQLVCFLLHLDFMLSNYCNNEINN